MSPGKDETRVCGYIYIYIYVIQGKNNQAINILIKKFQLLPLSIHVNILNYK